MQFFIAAYAVIWLVLFAFVFNMNRRMNKVSDELEIIEEAVGQQK
ncbi:MAG: CcmD family protein [Caldilineales bacterium]|nr:CcmD family protein [Caldilineales bacterium]